MAAFNVGKLMNQIKEDPAVIDQILYPGKQLADFDSSKLRIDVLPSGFHEFDEKMILKRDRGELIVIGARPSIGKSGLGFQLATNVAKYGKSHIFSLEMDHESVAARQISVILNRPLDGIQRGSVSGESIEEARKELSKYNCVIDDRAGLNVYQICDAARQQNKKSKTDLIVVDYLQIVGTDTTAFSRAEAVGRVSLELKNLAKELRVPVIALSQLNRMSETKDGKTGKTVAGEPHISQLKESGSIEQDADVIMLIHRPLDTPGSVKIIVAKNRNGPTGDIPMQFAAGQCRFISGDVDLG